MSPLIHSGDSAIVVQMRPALIKYFRRKCGSLEEAEDLAQDVLIRSLGHVDPTNPERAKGYIFRVAVNRWRDRQRRLHTRGSTQEWIEDPERDAHEEMDPQRVLIIEQELDRVAHALSQLPERTRDVFVLVRLEQMKQAEVAQMLGISLSTVEKELVNALAHLARCAERDEMP